MKCFSIYLSLLALILASSCSQKEEELDYDNMVMADEEDDEWTPGQEQDIKAIADLDPQESIINE
jgi:hypothetical protein